MIPRGMVDEIRRMLAGGAHSQRQIARMTGVSRATVGAIASGVRPDYPLRPPGDEFLMGHECGTPKRCPGCGGRVFLPCRLCYVRRLKHNDVARRRRRAWLVEYLSGPIVPKAVLTAAEAHERSARSSPR